MERAIIDTDPGVDDAHALMMALAHPGVRVEAITTVAGNVDLAQTTANARIILEVFRQDVPLYAGCDRPLISKHEDAVHVYGRDGLGDAGFPPSTRQIEAEHAAATLVRLAGQCQDHSGGRSGKVQRLDGTGFALRGCHFPVNFDLMFRSRDFRGN